MPDQQRMSGEDDFIQAYFAPLAAGHPGSFGLNDDCAALTPEPGHDIVLKTDAIAEGVHFLPGDAPDDIAWKAVAVNVSDLAAKAARPVGYLMSLAFPQMPERAWMAKFADGLRRAQDSFGITLMGGDTDRRPNAPLSVSIMVLGSVPTGRMVRRATAQAGDIIYVSGTLGDSALGLRLRTGAIAADAIGPSERRTLEQRYLRPDPRIGLRSALLAHARAAMDLSDGLAKDLGRMCRASGVGAEVDQCHVPLSAPARAVIGASLDLQLLPLNGGDDYEILAAIAPEQATAFEAAANQAAIPVTAIGRFTAGNGVIITGRDGRKLDLPVSGYDHF